MKAPLGVVAAAAALLWAAPAGAATRRYTVVVASSTSITKGVPALQFADDDGARYYEMFSAAGDDVLLYTVLDADSQRLYPDAARVARAPRKEAVLEGLTEVFSRAAAAVAHGDQVVFTFVLVGHGEIGPGGEAFVSLLDAPLTRSDLFHQVLARSPATTNHIVIDACDSYFLVHARGAGYEDDSAPSQRAAVSGFLADEDLARYPNTGLLLSTSSARESHEWAAFGAGVFSHELRSAAAGAADVNGDGRIEYSEIAAFIAAANLRIDDPRARLAIYAHPPALDASRPFIDLSKARFAHWLRIPAGSPLHVYLEDARGVRYLDANLSGDRPVTLALVPSPHYYVRSDDGSREARVALGKSGRVDLRRDQMRRARVAARGATAEAFRTGLFAVPYGLSFYEGYVGSLGADPVDQAVRPFAPPPQVADAALVDDEIARLDAASAADPALARRLRRVTPALLRALSARRYDEALRLLDGAEGGVTSAPR